MILVTVGSTNHDDLIKVIDELLKEKKIKDKVICQIGRGKYESKNCEFFRFDPKIDEKYYQKCKTIICVDSAGTLFRNLELDNKIIAVRHPTTKGALDLGRKLAQEGYIDFIEDSSNCEKLKLDLQKFLNNQKANKKYVLEQNNIAKRISDYILE
jgi:UDP-N-acetylglucosamine transferase subunit ALG13